MADTTTTTTKSTQAGLAPYAMPYIADLYGRTRALTSQEFLPYQGERIAQFTPLQTQAYTAAEKLGEASATTEAESIAKKAGTAALGAAYTPTAYTPTAATAQQATAATLGAAPTVSTGVFTDPGTVSSYMSPYAQNVVDIQQREAQRQADIATQQRNAQMARAGAFGGSRQAIMDAEAARNLAIQKGDIQAQGLQAAYQQAQQQFNADQARQLQAAMATQQLAGQYGLTGAQLSQQAALQNAQLGTQTNLANLNAALQAQQMNQQAAQYGAGLGLQGAQAAVGAAGALGSIGANQYQQTLGNLNAQATLGAQQQQQVQNILSQQYQDYMNQYQYPYQNLQFAQSIYQGFPMGQSTTIGTSQAPQPSAWQNVAGLSAILSGVGSLFGKAKGGQIKEPRSAGLADLMISKLD